MQLRELWEVLVPVRDWYGDKIHISEHKEWDSKICAITKGLSLQKTINGKWFSKENDIQEEEMIPVRIACTREQLTEIVELTLNHYRQDAVMAYKISDEVIIQEKPKVC